MFKERVKQWGLEKNKKETTVLALLANLKKNGAIDSESQLHHEGRTFNVEDLLKHIGRKKIALVDIQPGESTSFISQETELSTLESSTADDDDHGFMSTTGTTEFGFALSAAASRLFPAITFHLDLPGPNQLTNAITHYYSSNFRTQTWILATPDSDIHSLYPSMALASCFQDYYSLNRQHRTDAAFARLNDAFIMLKPLLHTEDPRLLVYLLESIAFTRAVGYTDIARHLLTSVAHLSAVILSPTHPLTLITTAISSQFPAHTSTLITLILNTLLTTFTTHLSPTHVETLRLLLTTASILKHLANTAVAGVVLASLAQRYECVYGRHSYQVVHALVDQAYLRMEEGAADADELIAEADGSVLGIHDWNERVESGVRCKVARARWWGRLGEVEMKREMLEEALELAIGGGLGEEHWMVKDVRGSLEECGGPNRTEGL